MWTRTDKACGELVVAIAYMMLSALAPAAPAGMVAAATGPIAVQAVLVVDGLGSPVGGANAGDGSGRLFILEQRGRIRVIQNGQLLSAPFLDLTDRVIALNSGYDERGLLGLAFHPQYKQNGRFFVYYSAPPQSAGANCTSVLSEFHVSAQDPNIADPSSERKLFQVDKPEMNHNGGMLNFGPDGYLYVSLGDGGGGGDQHGTIGNGQNLQTILGKILRIDVNGALPYAIPTDNPFVSSATAQHEIWAYGFRNPWKFDFDHGGAHRLFCGDVGQDLWEEVDIVQGGGNYGWRVMEGMHCFNPPTGCDTSGKILPIIEQSHAFGDAIIGGYIYRGQRYPSLMGKYLYGFLSDSGGIGPGRLFYLTETPGGTWDINEFVTNGGPGSTFGIFIFSLLEGEDGELYVMGSTFLSPTSPTGGNLYHLEIPTEDLRNADLNHDGTVNTEDLDLFQRAWQTTVP